MVRQGNQGVKEVEHGHVHMCGLRHLGVYVPVAEWVAFSGMGSSVWSSCWVSMFRELQPNPPTTALCVFCSAVERYFAANTTHSLVCRGTMLGEGCRGTVLGEGCRGTVLGEGCRGTWLGEGMVYYSLVWAGVSPSVVPLEQTILEGEAPVIIMG